MNFKDFELSTVKDTITIDSYKVPFTVLKYLPIEDKNDLIQAAIQNSEENGMINPLKLDMYFGLYLIYMYTNIEFTEDERSDEVALYNTLYSNGIIDVVICALNQIDKSEYEYLYNKLVEMAYRKVEYNNTLASVINGFIDRLPVNAEQALEIINKFNPEDFQNVMQFVRAANGDRAIN